MIEGVLEQIRAFVVGQFSGAVAYVADPIWGWVIIVLAVVAGCTLIGWFFPAVRSFFGAVALASVAYVVGRWNQRKYDRSTKPVAKPKPKPPTPTPSNRWPWS